MNPLNTSRRSSLSLLIIVLSATIRLATAADESTAIHFGSGPGELVVSEISDRTVRIELFSLDDAGQRRVTEAGTALISFPAVEKLRTRSVAANVELQSGRLRVQIKKEPFSLSIRREDGTVVQELTLGNTTNAAVGFRAEAPVLGLGEGAQQFDRRGALYPMEPTWGGWNRAVFGSVVPSPFLIGTEGWALFASSPDGQFDLRESAARFLPKTGRPNHLSLFVSDVRNPADALSEYIRLTGRPVMPPKWTAGYFQSHRTLAGPEEPLEIARTFREKKLPCDAVIYLGTGYCPAGWNTGHGSVTFNPKTFDRPQPMIDALHALNLKIVLHVNRAPRNIFGLSIAEESDSPLHIRNYWKKHQETFAMGVDGWWPDDGDELPLEPRITRHRCYYEGSLLDRPNVRPWSLHRTGYSGVQRYGGWIWSGDIDSTWATLAAQVSVGLNHSLSLTPFWGSDTGGFYPSKELTGELYARWFEFSAFCPSFRSHGRTWKLRLPWGWNTGEFGPVEHNGGPDKSELHNAAIEPICRKYLELRYRLLPYNYSLMREASDTGLPMMRALWLHYPGDPAAVAIGNEYLWGRDLLVAPVVEKGATLRRLYLPAGDWYDWWNGSKTAGPRWIERSAGLDTLPLYVRAGSIIPLDPVRQYTGEPVKEAATLRVYPGANGSFVLYDDDGQSLGYRDGSDAKTVWIRFTWDDAVRRLTAEPDGRMKKWPGGTRAFKVELAGSPAVDKRIEFEGRSVEVRF